MVTTLGIYMQRPLGPLDSCPEPWTRASPGDKDGVSPQSCCKELEGNVMKQPGCAWQTVRAAEEFVLTAVLGTLLEEGVCPRCGLESEGG